MSKPTPLQPSSRHEQRVTVSGVGIDLVQFGKGPPLLFLHSVSGIDPDQTFLAELGQRFEVYAPWHPGFGHSSLPTHYRTIGDLALFYLEFLDHFDLHDIWLAGTSFGGWLACEIAVRDVSRIKGLVLLDPLGIKVGDRETRDIADMHAMSQEELTRRAYFNIQNRKRDYSTMTEWELFAIARSREAYTYFGWQPYMHNPQLKHWLKRVRRPALVIWGEHDGIVAPGYGRAFADALPDARFHIVAEAGHYPHVENPDSVLALIDEFCATDDQRLPVTRRP